MILKNTSRNRKLVNRLSHYLCETTAFFRPMVDKGWNCGEDIRFEIASVGLDNPLIISTAYTRAGEFWFKVRLLKTELEDAHNLMRMRFRLDDCETILMNIRTMVEAAKPELSEIE